MHIDSFKITGLYGQDTIALRFVDNRLVLVGENGSGKSTALNAMYYFLTRQWNKLAEFSFEGCTAVINEQELVLLTDDIRRPIFSDELMSRYLIHFMDEDTAQRVTRMLREHPPSHWMRYPDQLTEHARTYNYEPSIVTSAISAVTSATSSATPTIPENVQKISAWMEQNVTSQVLFLPTYRRIERDLQHIFKDVRVERDTRQFNRKNVKRGGYVELVEFGMRDVEVLFREAMQRLDREFRSDLNKLTADYLRAVINQEHLDAQYEALTISTQQVEALINRIDKILPIRERKELLNLVVSIRRNQQVPAEKKVVAHFLSMLVKIHERQEKREAKVRSLSEVCNSYFGISKQLLFDPVQFELKFILTDTQTEVGARDLSSGEKQIVSLFTHLLLSGQQSFVVLIDEPELSISVPWQRRFLSDIAKSGLCEVLVAVTHSPFVFENELAPYAHSISEFRTRSN